MDAPWHIEFGTSDDVSNEFVPSDDVTNELRHFRLLLRLPAPHDGKQGLNSDQGDQWKSKFKKIEQLKYPLYSTINFFLLFGTIPHLLFFKAKFYWKIAILKKKIIFFFFTKTRCFWRTFFGCLWIFTDLKRSLEKLTPSSLKTFLNQYPPP